MAADTLFVGVSNMVATSHVVGPSKLVDLPV